MFGIPFSVPSSSSEDYSTKKWEEKDKSNSVNDTYFLSNIWETIKNTPYLISKTNLSIHLWSFFSIFGPVIPCSAKFEPSKPYLIKDKPFTEEVQHIEKKIQDLSLLPTAKETKNEIYDLTQKIQLMKDRLQLRKDHDNGTPSNKKQIEILKENLRKADSFISDEKKSLHIANVISELRETEKTYLENITCLSKVLEQVEGSVMASAHQLTAKSNRYASCLISPKMRRFKKSLIEIDDFSLKLNKIVFASKKRLELIQKNSFEDISKAYNLLHKTSASDQAEYNIAYTTFINFVNKIENNSLKKGYKEVFNNFHNTLPEGKTLQFYASQPFQRGPRLLLLAKEALKKGDESSQKEHMEHWVRDAKYFNRLINDLLGPQGG
ncbi:MAG: hypothetical protein ACI9S8_000628 [Chlamydiales bacterium]|jgi:hypothetical protein